MIKSVFIPLFFVTFVVIIARGEPQCPKYIKTTTTLPFEGDCKKFYICSPLGGKVGLSCLNGYNFNPERGVCEDEKKYECPYENDSPQPRFDSFSKENVFPWIKPNATRGTDNLEDGSNGNLEVFGRTFFNWFKDGDKQSDPTDFLRPFIRHTLSAILSPIIYPLQRILKCFKNAFMVIKNVICNCSNSIPA